jgi:hypothetical protein
MRAMERWTAGAALPRSATVRAAMLLFALGCGAACGGSRDDISGTYKLDRPAGAGCVLGARLDEPRAVHVELRCSAAAPARGSGELSGMAAVEDGEAVYRTREFGGSCTLRFRFPGATATVAQTGSAEACGFAAGVSATGTYRRTSRDPWTLPVAHDDRGRPR